MEHISEKQMTQKFLLSDFGQSFLNASMRGKRIRKVEH